MPLTILLQLVSKLIYLVSQLDSNTDERAFSMSLFHVVGLVRELNRGLG